MSLDWPVVVLMLGAMLAGVVVWVERQRGVDATLRKDVVDLQRHVVERATNATELSQRIGKLEAAMRIDGQRIMREANKASIPEFMK